MQRKIHFTPGPSELYFTVETHIKQALKTQFTSQSHRGKDFKDCYQLTAQNLRLLLNIPDNYEVLFTSSATEVWERLIQNCVVEKSIHLVNGSFSKRFYQSALELGLPAIEIASEAGSCARPEDIGADANPELIAFTHNETSTGAAQPLEDIYMAKKAFPNALIAVDIVSSTPYVDLDLNQVDCAYFSVQKSFGLPSGLGVWLVNNRCIQKAEKLAKEGRNLGTYHSLPNLVKQAKSFQTPETPNMLGIYLLGRVAHDMLEKGLDQIRKEIDYKAALLYHTIESHSNLSPFVKNPDYRSKTVIVAETSVASEMVINHVASKSLVIGKGYGNFKEQHIRVANFATHSKEQVELLCDQLNTFN